MNGTREWSRLQMRCGQCNNLIEHMLETGIPVTEFVAVMSAVRCDTCGSKKILMGQNRTREEDTARAKAGGSVAERVDDWNDHGEVGQSSKAIVAHMQGHPEVEMTAPRDVSDLRRCVLLLLRIPEWSARMGEMAAHPQWSRLAPNWDDVVISLMAETGEGLEHLPHLETSAMLDGLL